MIAESTEVAQVEEPMASTSEEDNTLQTSTAEQSTVEFVALTIASEASTIQVPKMPVMTSALTEPAVGLVSVPSEMAPASMSIARTIIERWSGSAPIELAPAMDIMEELAHQMVQQFFTSIRSCIELVISRRSSFEFARMLLEN